MIRRNPLHVAADPTTVIVVMGGALLVAGGFAYWLYTLTHDSTSAPPPAPTVTGTDAAGNPTSATITPGGIGVFTNTQPGPLGPGEST